MFVFSSVYSVHKCVCSARWPHLGYPLQPVQKTNKPHFNLRNINFPLDGKLIMAQELSHLTLSKTHSVTAIKTARKPQ